MDNAPFPSSDRSRTSTGSSGLGSTGSSSGVGGSTYSSTGSMGGAGSGGTDAREALERVQGAVHSTVDKLASTARDWAGKIDEKARGVSDIPKQALEYSRSTVQEHPMQAILLSMLVGYVIGRFSGGRSTRYGE